MAVLNFIVNEIFGQGAIFLAMIAMIGLLLQKKDFSAVVLVPVCIHRSRR